MGITLSTLAKELKKHVKVVPIQKKRGLLEQLVFAILLENAPAATAEYHFDRLEEDFVDLNELRIASHGELVERFTQKPYVKDEKYVHPYPDWAAERITQALQWILDQNDGLEINHDRLKNAAEARDFLSKNPYATRFVVDFVLHFELGYGPIPFDEGARRALRVLALTKPDGDDIRGLSDLSRKKAEADNLFWTLHQFGVSMKTGDENPDEEALAILYGLDKKANQRSWLALEPCDFDVDPHELTRTIHRSMSRANTKRSPMSFDENDEDTDSENDDFSGGFGEEDARYEDNLDRLDDDLISEVPPQPQKDTAAWPKKEGKKVSAKAAGKADSKESSPRGRKSSDKSADRSAPPSERSSVVKPKKQGVSEPKEEPQKPRRSSKNADDPKETKGSKQAKVPNRTKDSKGTKSSKQAEDSKGTKPLKKTELSPERPVKKAPRRSEESKAVSSTAANDAKTAKRASASKPAVKAPKTKAKPAAEKSQKPKPGLGDRKDSGKKAGSPNKNAAGAAASPKKKAAKGKLKK